MKTPLGTPAALGHPVPRRARTAAVAAVAALLAVTGCSGGGSERAEADPTTTAASPSPSPSTSISVIPWDEPTEPAEPMTAKAVLTAAEHLRVLRQLVRTDTGYFELSVGYGDNGDPQVAGLPRMAGGWRVGTNDSVVTTSSLDSDGSQNLATYLTTGGQIYVRTEGKGSPFGADCWAKLPQDTGPLAGRSFGLPSAFTLVATYRPSGRPEAGTANLAAVLGAVGFQKVANLDLAAVRRVRVPVDLSLGQAGLADAMVYPADLVAALADVEAPARDTRKLRSLLKRVTPAYWRVRYHRLGDPINLSAPPADKLLDLDGEHPTCPRAA